MCNHTAKPSTASPGISSVLSGILREGVEVPLPVCLGSCVLGLHGDQDGEGGGDCFSFPCFSLLLIFLPVYFCLSLSQLVSELQPRHSPSPPQRPLPLSPPRGVLPMSPARGAGPGKPSNGLLVMMPPTVGPKPVGKIGRAHV